MKRHAEIAGGGIGGLGLGLMLAHNGWSVRIHERSPVIREIGSAISLRNNCITVLERYGAFARIEPLGSMLQEEFHYDAHGRFVQKRSLTGQHRTLVISRQALVEGLAAAAREAGAEIVTASQIVSADPAGTLIDERGGRWLADLVVGADGVNSKVRPAVGAGSTFEILDTRVDRYLIKTRAFASEGQMFEHWSRDRRVGIMPGGPGLTYVYTVMPANDEAAGRHPLDVENWTRAFPTLRGAFEELSRNESTQSLYPLVRCPRWSSGRIALLGDAAHGMPPTLGQGAGLTMMNGHALATLVSRMDDVPQALRRWERSVRYISDTTQRWAIRYNRFTRYWPPAVRPQVIWAFGRFKALNRRMRLADMGISLIEARLA